MYFQGRELNDYAKPVSPSDLHQGQIYFAVNYVDNEMLVPIMESLVFIGRNLGSGDVSRVYFQDVESHREGVEYNWNANDGSAKFQSGSEDKINHIFDYEHALEELMRCSLRRREKEQS